MILRNVEVCIGSRILVDSVEEVIVTNRVDNEIFWRFGEHTSHCDVSRCELIHEKASKMYYIVRFHADGGQMCVPGVRCVENELVAKLLADKLSSEPGHSCKNSVKIELSDTFMKNEGSFNIDISSRSNFIYENDLIYFCKNNEIPWHA